MIVGSVSVKVAPSPFGRSASNKDVNAYPEKADAIKPGSVAEGKEAGKMGVSGKGLSEQDLKQLEALKARDREVRAHEAAHMAAAGGLARGGASFTYVRGADGVFYAVGGEVSIDISPVAGDPEATLRKAETIRRAALAPANPSSQDRQVAAAANQMEGRALMDVAKARQARSPIAQAYTQSIGEGLPSLSGIDLAV